jgi:hypothetical protein
MFSFLVWIHDIHGKLAENDAGVEEAKEETT